jgi:tRNA modification GTPase
MSEADTIAAIATPPGRGAIAIVRCSGPGARRIAARVFRSRLALIDRMATYGTIVDVAGRPIDRGLAIAMDGPRTVTGEDVVELHIHGSPVAARETLRGLIAAGARLAEPGEFTRRAFLNGKLDLSAAEAVADLIAAESRAAAVAATANLTGGLQRLIEAVRSELRTLLEELAGAVDFPDEIPEPEAAEVATRLGRLDATLAGLARDGERGRIVREGLALAIVGPPNAGKSSLLNALVGEERAIVSPIAGTTRDTIEESFAIDGVLVRAIDTAGLRSGAEPLEAIGIERRARALAAATLALVVVDGAGELPDDARTLLAETRGRPRIVFFNKRDLGRAAYDEREAPERGGLLGSAFDAASVAELRVEIARVGWQGEDLLDATRPHLAGARHDQAVERARRALADARATLSSASPLDLIAGDLLTASAALGEITGGAATEELLDGIFARFCIGK